jgi:hypothetical protein
MVIIKETKKPPMLVRIGKRDPLYIIGRKINQSIHDGNSVQIPPIVKNRPHVIQLFHSWVHT